MAGWGKLVAGAVIGAAGALYATNEELRKRLPGAARDLPETVKRRFEAATAAGREAAALRRAEIMKELEARGADQAGRRSLGPPAETAAGLPAAPEEPSEAVPPRVVRRNGAGRVEHTALPEE